MALVLTLVQTKQIRINIHKRNNTKNTVQHNEELNDLYSTPSIVRVIKSGRMKWHVARMGERGGAYRVLVGKPEEKRLLGRRRRKWEDNIKMDL